LFGPQRLKKLAQKKIRINHDKKESKSCPKKSDLPREDAINGVQTAFRVVSLLSCVNNAVCVFYLHHSLPDLRHHLIVIKTLQQPERVAASYKHIHLLAPQLKGANRIV